MTPQEFATKIKAKYPEYKDMDDLELTNRIIKKYPQYESRVSLPESEPETPLREKVASGLDTVFGGGKIGEAIGTQIAKSRATEEEKQFIEGPTGKEVAGDALRTGVMFAPIGRLAGLLSKGARAIGIGEKSAKVAGNIGSGATVGGTADVGVSMAEGGDARLGFGTLLGVGIPAASPVAGALGKVIARGARRGAFETSGVLTGTSEETLEQAFQAAKKGGKDLDEFTEAMRGRSNPEKLVEDLKSSINTVKTDRSTLYRETLEELSDQVVSTQPAKANFAQTLNKFKITVKENGTLDFTKSELRTVPAAQAKIQQAWTEVSNMPESLSIGELDTTRQAVKAIKSIAGDDPSSNKANALIEEATRSVRKAGEQVDGYGKMLDNFGESSEFLEELERGLSAGDRATVDQTYRRVITSMRTNNEQRQALLQELDDATGGALLSEISGQQLNEFLPRGIIGRFIAPFIAGGAVTGGLSGAMIPGLMFASPRLTGEFARAIGLTAAKTEGLIQAIDESRNLLVKLGAISGAVINETSDETMKE